MFGKVLVPYAGPLMPARAFVCFKEAHELPGFQSTIVGPQLLEWQLGLSLREYLEYKAHELSALGIKASPMLARGHAAHTLLNCAQKNGAGVFLLSVDGPYQLCGESSEGGRALGCSSVPLLKYVCFGGVVYESPALPILLDSTLQGTELRCSLSEYLGRRVQQVDSSGIQGDKLFLRGTASHSIARVRDVSETGIFLISLRGPYVLQSTDFQLYPSGRFEDRASGSPPGSWTGGGRPTEGRRAQPSEASR